MNWKIDDVPAFAAIVDHGGISAAADHLGLAKSTVSKSLSRLEAALNLRLLERNSRNVRLTSEGQVFYRHCQTILEQVESTNAEMNGLAEHPHGKLVVALPIAFCREIVAPQLPRFHARYPQIELDILVTSQRIDLIRDQIDLAVTIGSQSDSELISRTLYQSRLVWITSPAYAASQSLTSSPDALRQHIKVCETRYASHRFTIRHKQQTLTLDLSRDLLRINDPLSVREMVERGFGISFLPDQYCRDAIDRGRLLQIYPDISIDTSASVLSVMYPSRRLLSGKTRAFLNFLDDICEKI